MTPDQEARLRARAEAEGLDAEALVALARTAAPSTADAPEPDAPKTEVKIYQYHLPFMRVRELRAFIGLSERIPDDDALCGEFLARHGGALVSGPDTGPAAQAAGKETP